MEDRILLPPVNDANFYVLSKLVEDLCGEIKVLEFSVSIWGSTFFEEGNSFLVLVSKNKITFEHFNEMDKQLERGPKITKLYFKLPQLYLNLVRGSKSRKSVFSGATIKFICYIK